VLCPEKPVSEQITKIENLYVSSRGHATFVQLTIMIIIEKIAIIPVM